MRAYKFKGHQARRRREELGLTARELAAAVGVSESAVCAYEREDREPRGSVYISLCRALQVDPGTLRRPVVLRRKRTPSATTSERGAV